MGSGGQGACLCGAVRFSFEVPTLWCSHCHCTMCQRAHGAAFVTWVGVAEADVAIEDGGDQLRWFSFSPGADRGFCARCGASVFFRSSQWPGELHITRANLTGAIDREPQLHVYADTMVDWVELGDHLPRRADEELA